MLRKFVCIEPCLWSNDYYSVFILNVAYCYRYKFPSILLVYFLLSPMILDITYLIQLFGREALFCRSSDLLETIENSTPFCSFTGLYITISMIIINDHHAKDCRFHHMQELLTTSFFQCLTFGGFFTPSHFSGRWSFQYMQNSSNTRSACMLWLLWSLSFSLS